MKKVISICSISVVLLIVSSIYISETMKSYEKVMQDKQDTKTTLKIFNECLLIKSPLSKKDHIKTCELVLTTKNKRQCLEATEKAQSKILCGKIPYLNTNIKK